MIRANIDVESTIGPGSARIFSPFCLFWVSLDDRTWQLPSQSIRVVGIGSNHSKNVSSSRLTNVSISHILPVSVSIPSLPYPCLSLAVSRNPNECFNSLTVPPESVEIFDPSGQRSSKQLYGPLSEGSDLTLICLARGGKSPTLASHGGAQFGLTLGPI